MQTVTGWRLFVLTVLSSTSVWSEIPIKRDCLCGEANTETGGRIVNGVRTTAHKYPWMAAMLNAKRKFMCGGSVISDRNILTAGHCVFYTNFIKTAWVVGAHDANTDEGELLIPTSFELHPNFANDSFYDDFDMAIVTIEQGIEFNHDVKPICLPSIGSQYSGERALVAGWGKLGESKSAGSATVLMETHVVIKSDKECKRLTDKLILYNAQSMICAYERDTDACQGDSGGPLFLETEPNRHEVLGTVSFGEGCARAFPGIYAKVATPNTLDWIKRTIESSGAAMCNDPPRARSRSNIERAIPLLPNADHVYWPIRHFRQV